MRKTLTLLLAVALTTVAGASGATGPASSKPAAQNLSTSAGVERYLTSLGIYAKGVVVQRGTRNYAGPSCPGKGWSCTKAKRVLQISQNENRFECTPSSAGPQTGPNSCTIVQNGPGTNRARCVERSDSPTVTQTCSIVQTNASGDNEAYVKQTIDADGAASDVRQAASVTQMNGTGSNRSHIDQTISQRSKSRESSGAQIQEGHQTASVMQTSVTGDNASDIDQSLDQDAEAKNEDGPVMQEQNAENTGPNTDATVSQTNTMGENKSRLHQRNDLRARAKKNDTGNQTQGSSDGGLNGQVDQSSAGISVSHVQQDEKQRLQPEKNTALMQEQFGPLSCCSSQTGNPANRVKIDQQSTQEAGDNAFQSNAVFGNCFTSGTCSVDQRVRENGDTTTNSCDGFSCQIAIFCSEGACVPTPGPPSCVICVAAPASELLAFRRGR